MQSGAPFADELAAIQMAAFSPGMYFLPRALPRHVSAARRLPKLRLDRSPAHEPGLIRVIHVAQRGFAKLESGRNRVRAGLYPGGLGFSFQGFQNVK